MKTGWKTRLAVVVAVVAAAGVLSGGIDAQRIADAASGPVHPSLLSGIYYRPLTVFSRGGRVTAVAGVPSNTQLYYMGAAGGGVWRTQDAGVVWEPLTDGQINVGTIGAVAVADSNPSILYVGTGSADPRGNVSNGDGVYKSVDAGKTWQHVGLDKAGLIGRIRIHPQNPDIAFVAALGNIFGPNKERGVYRTKDGGRTWDAVLQVSDRTGAIEIDMDAGHPDTLFAAMWTVERKPWTLNSGSVEGGLFRSTDGGSTWRKLSAGLPKGVLVGKAAVSISRTDSKRVYALIEAGGDQGGVFLSDDGGDSWTRVNSGRNLQQRAFYYTKIYADPVTVDTVYALNTGAYRSTDGGKTWQGIGTPHGDNHDLWINPTNAQAMINGNDGGANVSLDSGRTWSTQDNQPTAEIYRIAVDTRWPYWIYGAQQDNSTITVPSNNVGETSAVGGGESGHIAVDPRNANLIYAGSYGGLVTRYDRYTGVMEDVRVYADSETGQRAADMKYRFQWNSPIRLSPHNPDIVYTTSQYVHRSRDGGQTWERISDDLTRNDKKKQDYSGGEGVTRDNTGVEVYGVIFAFEESPVTAGLLWAGSDDGLVHLSRDNGKSWQRITPPGLPEFTTVNAIDLSPTRAGHAIVTAYGYMLNDMTPYAFETNDYGQTWKRVADGAHGIPVGHFTRVVREDPDRPGLLYAGTEYGMYISFDDGGHWQRFQQNLPVTPIMDLKVHRKNLIVATEGRAFWVLDDLSVVQQLKMGLENSPGVLFKPVDGYRQGGQLPTFQYWLKDAPTAAVSLQVMDAAGATVFTTTAEPAAGIAPPPPVIAPRPAAGAGRGGRGAGGGGGGGGRGGFGAFGGGGFGANARQGLNRATWAPRLSPLFTIPPRIIMWGGGGGAPKAAPGTYTVKVTSGSWSESQTFRLLSDPRLPPVTEAEGAAVLKMANDVGGWVKQLYATLAQLRDAKQQAAQIADKAAADSPLKTAAKTFTDKLVAVEGDITQLQGEGGQDALNYPGRLDNQLVVLYGALASLERKLNTAVSERYTDLKPQFDSIMVRASTVLKADVAAFNTAATSAGAQTIVIK